MEKQIKKETIKKEKRIGVFKKSYLYDIMRQYTDTICVKVSHKEKSFNLLQIIRSEKRFDMSKKMKVIIPGVVAGLAVLIIIGSSVTTVKSGYTGVVTTFGEVTGSMDPGLHLQVPFVQSVIEMSNKIQKVETQSEAVSKDLQTVSNKVAVNFHINKTSSEEIYKNIGISYESTILEPAILESVKATTAKYNAEALVTNRSAIGKEMKELLEAKMDNYGVIIDDFNIINFDFSQEYNNAIEQKQVAEQNKLKAATEKEQAIIEAQAEAEKKKIAAEAEAQAILAKADAEAKANQMLNSSLSQNVIAFQQIQKWNGEYPSVVADGTSILVDPSRLTQQPEQGQ